MTPDRKHRLARWLFAAAAPWLFAANTHAQSAQRSAGWIVLPSAEYQSLRDRAYPVEPGPEPSRAQATLSRIHYDLQINGELAVGQATLTVDVLKGGWVRIPIPSALLVRDAKLEGKALSLIEGSDGGGEKAAVFSHQGRATLILDIVMPITVHASSESIALPAAPAGITRASIQLPRQGVDIKLTGGFLAEKSAPATENRYVAYGNGREDLVFSWWRKIEEVRTSQPLRLRGSLTELVGLGEDSTSVQAEVNAEILQGAALEMKLRLPEKVAINQVAGAMIADWEMKPGELTVKFLEPVEKTARFLIAGETRSPRDGQIDIPLIRLLQAERETGGVAVEVLGAGEITDRKSAGLENADASDLGEIVSMRQSPSLVAFRFRSGDVSSTRSLSVNIARYTQEAVLLANIEEARYRILMSRDGKSLVQASYAIRNNQRNFLKVKLPADAVVWSATLSGKPIRPGQAPDGSLLLPLEKARAGEDAPAFAAEILYGIRVEKWNDAGRLKLSLPLLDLPVSRTGLQYFYPPLYKVTPEPGAFRMQEFQMPAAEVLKRPMGGSGASFAAAPAPSLPLVSNSVMDLINVMGGVVAQESGQGSQALVTQYQARAQEGKRAGILPIRMSFPAFGPSIFFVSELTAENHSPAIELEYEADAKGGAR